MSTTFLYHGFGLSGYDYVNTKYQGGAVTFTVEHKPFSLHWPECHSRKLKRRDTIRRFLRTLPIGGKVVWLFPTVQRIQCLACGLLRQASIGFVEPCRSYTNSSERYTLELSSRMTIRIRPIAWR